MLTVTSAILLDAFLGTLGREEMMEELGFFFYFLSGGLLAGAAVWFWSIAKPFVSGAMQSFSNDEKALPGNPPHDEVRDVTTQDETYVELLEELLSSVTTDDLHDLLFDLGYQDQEIRIDKDRDEQLALYILRTAKNRGDLEKLPAAIDRIKSPIPLDNLPRLEKLNSETPPTILRHYLLNVFSLTELEQLRHQLEVNKSGDEFTIKRLKVRQLLSELYDRNEITNLIVLLQTSADKEAIVDNEVQE